MGHVVGVVSGVIRFGQKNSRLFMHAAGSTVLISSIYNLKGTTKSPFLLFYFDFKIVLPRFKSIISSLNSSQPLHMHLFLKRNPQKEKKTNNK